MFQMLEILCPPWLIFLKNFLTPSSTPTVLGVTELTHLL